jgi:hypothetical protein
MLMISPVNFASLPYTSLLSSQYPRLPVIPACNVFVYTNERSTTSSVPVSSGCCAVVHKYFGSTDFLPIT